jgi:hypothetical protein
VAIGLFKRTDRICGEDGSHPQNRDMPLFCVNVGLGLGFSVVQSHSLEALTCQTSKLHMLKNRNLVSVIMWLESTVFTHLRYQ